MTRCANVVQVAPERQAFTERIARSSGQPISSCYHCGRCGGGCPVADAAGMTPDGFLWLIQMGLEAEAARSKLLWLCVGCGTCGARCPNQIATNEVIDHLRTIAADDRQVAKEVKAVRTFHKLLLNQVRRHGRLHELSLIAALKLRTLALFKDIMLGQRMFLRGKIPLLPHSLFGIGKVKSLFAARREREAGDE